MSSCVSHVSAVDVEIGPKNIVGVLTYCLQRVHCPGTSDTSTCDHVLFPELAAHLTADPKLVFGKNYLEDLVSLLCPRTTMTFRKRV